LTFNEIEEFNKLKGTKQDLQEFAVNYTYDTQAIEGSTVTLEDTKNILVEGNIPANRDSNFVIETQKHYDVFFDILSQKDNISYSNIMKWHYNQFQETKPDIAGGIRTVDVGIYGTKIRFPPWKSIPYHLIEFFHWYNRVKDGIHPVYLAALAHLKLVNIHPFEDGNGRTSRLLMNFILHRNGFPMLNIHYTERRNYYESLNMAREYDEWEFVKFISRKMVGMSTNVREDYASTQS